MGKALWICSSIGKRRENENEWMGSEKGELFWTLPDLHEIYSFKNNNAFVLNYKSK